MFHVKHSPLLTRQLLAKYACLVSETHALVGRRVQYTDKTGKTVQATVIRSDGWSLELDNGGYLRALPRYFVDQD